MLEQIVYLVPLSLGREVVVLSKGLRGTQLIRGPLQAASMARQRHTQMLLMGMVVMGEEVQLLALLVL
jgi:hypothetical protein